MGKRLTPKGKLDAATVGAFTAELVACRGQDVVLDLCNVTHFGALPLQSCLAAARAARDGNREFSVINATPPVLEHMRVMGFSPETLAEGCA